MYTFAAKSPADLMKKIKRYTLKDVATKIKTPMLIIDSESDSFMHGQATKLYSKLKSPKTFLMFTKEQAAQARAKHT